MNTAFHRARWQTRCLVVLGSFLLVANGRSQNTASTSITPVNGLRTIPCAGGSDTLVSTPFDRPPVYVGSGTPSINGGTAKLTFSGATFTTDQFVHVLGTQPNTYFVRFTSGPREGSFFTITGNDTISVTLDLAGEDLSTLTGAVGVVIIPYWTLGTLFPNGRGVTAKIRTTAGTVILLPDTTSAGIELGPASFYFYSRRASSWIADSKPKAANDVVLAPNRFFTVRNEGPNTTTVMVGGAAVSTKLAVALATNTDGPQDNAVALTRPAPVTLNDCGLISSGAFAASTGTVLGDQLLVFDNAAAGFNKAPAAVYTYSGGAWRKGGATGDAGTDAVFVPGTGVIIRKRATANGATALWINSPNY